MRRDAEDHDGRGQPAPQAWSYAANGVVPRVLDGLPW